ncbi:MAG TPA: metallophosphoesterase [Candidatus Brocadiaceae bacterium]|nr:metallophosphoesterase [Candidatus Brocadiaceae bacterium]
MRKKLLKIPLLLPVFLVVLCLFSLKLYAGPLRFIAYGDTRRNSDTVDKPQTKHNAIAKVIRELNPDFVLFSGDMVYNNEFEKFLTVVINNYAGDKRIPLYPVIGNHEVVVSEKLGGIEALIKARSRYVLFEAFKGRLDNSYSSYLNNIFDRMKPKQSWYSFVKQTNGVELQFIELNSSLPDDEDQFKWFLNELKRVDGPKVVLAHYPPYSTGQHGNESALHGSSREAKFRNRYTKVFNDPRNNVALVIGGHDHNYQRACKTDETGGIRTPVYLVSGGGGANLTGGGKGDVSQILTDGFQCQRFVTAYHFVEVMVTADSSRNVTIKCKAMGLSYDLSQGLPDDTAFEAQFVKERLELIDDFTVTWQSKRVSGNEF